MTATGLRCRSCGTELPPDSRFCNNCGAPITAAATSAEYKQVTVLFADVVHSMDIASAVGAERLREIMAALLDRSAEVVKRYGGTVDKFTGDGVMAVFGAPTALEDHAFRACLAALDIQEEAHRLANEVEHRDGITLELRIGLNSGQVIAGEIGSSTANYTAIGEQVGMAQRMESVAPPGGVMLSESTARLVEDTVVLAEPGLVRLKGADTPVEARRLLAIGEHQRRRRRESALVGRTWELNTITAILDEAIGGAGCVVNIVGPPGIGKSRLVGECAAVAADRGVPVFIAYCESHATDIPFHAVAGLIRATTGVEGLDADAARARIRARDLLADPEDLLLLDDLLGIRDPAEALPDIAPDARRRRLTALINGAALAQSTAGVYIVEDAQWIDEPSESMLGDFLAVIPQTPSLMLITHRPEYRGALSRVSGAPTVALRPLSNAHTSALTGELLGANPSVGTLGTVIVERACGNPFFVEEMVRDLAERGVLHGQPGAYRLQGGVANVDVPATLQAAIGARIDRLDSTAKYTLNAAAVIGTRFDGELLTTLIDNADVGALIEAELVEQIRFSPRAEYAFRHPLIRTVAYESQLKSARGQLHRRLATAIENRDPSSADENAALIAEHLEAAGDLHAAFAWHMRAGDWSHIRNIAASRNSWHRAQHVADRLPDDDPERMSMRIAPRTILCGTAFRFGGRGVHTGFDELRELCTAAGDQRSLAIGMAGLVMAQSMSAHCRQASQLGSELVRLLASIDDPTLTVALLFAPMSVKHDTEEMADVMQLAQRVIDLADGDLIRGDLIVFSPLTLALALRGVARACLGMVSWQEDIHEALTTGRSLDPAHRLGVIWYRCVTAISNGLLASDVNAERDSTELLAWAEQSTDDDGVDIARVARAMTLLYQDGPQRDAGFALLAELHGEIPQHRQIVDIHIAREKARLGDIDGAIELARSVVDRVFASGAALWSSLATSVLAESLLRRGSDADLRRARTAIDRLAAVPTDPGFALHEVWLLRLRALLAQADGDDTAYRDYRDSYRATATSLGFEGHIKWAEAMP
jgi:adenylate cyclase